MLTSQKVIDAIDEQIGYEFSAEVQYFCPGYLPIQVAVVFCHARSASASIVFHSSALNCSFRDAMFSSK
jgi:hypothetical protein